MSSVRSSILPLPSQFGCLLFIYLLFGQISVARISNTLLSKSGENGHPCLVPNFRGKAFHFSLLNVVLDFVIQLWICLKWPLLF